MDVSLIRPENKPIELENGLEINNQRRQGVSTSPQSTGRQAAFCACGYTRKPFPGFHAKYIKNGYFDCILYIPETRCGYSTSFFTSPEFMTRVCGDGLILLMFRPLGDSRRMRTVLRLSYEFCFFVHAQFFFFSSVLHNPGY